MLFDVNYSFFFASLSHLFRWWGRIGEMTDTHVNGHKQEEWLWPWDDFHFLRTFFFTRVIQSLWLYLPIITSRRLQANVRTRRFLEVHKKMFMTFANSFFPFFGLLSANKSSRVEDKLLPGFSATAKLFFSFRLPRKQTRNTIFQRKSQRISNILSLRALMEVFFFFLLFGRKKHFKYLHNIADFTHVYTTTLVIAVHVK